MSNKKLTDEEKNILEAARQIQRIEESREAFPLLHIVPTSMQKKFLRMAANEAAFFGANGSGKSFAGAYKAACYLVGHDPLGLIPYEIPKPTRYVAGVRVFTKLWLGCVNLEKGVELIKQNLLPLLPKDSYVFNEYKGLVKMKAGPQLKVMSYEMETNKWQSDAVDGGWMDEQCPWDKYQELRARVARRSGKIWLTLTPLTEFAPWMYWEIVKKADKGDKRFGYVTADIEDNYYLDEDQKKMMYDAYAGTEEEAARLHGSFGFTRDIIHSKFNHETHVIKPYPIDDRMREKFNFVRIFDLHQRQVSVMTLAMYQEAPREVVVLCELAMEGGVIRLWEFKKAVHEITKDFTEMVETDIIDTPDAKIDNEAENMGRDLTLMSLLSAFAADENYNGLIVPGISGIPANRDATNGVRRFNELLLLKDGFKIFNTCPRHIKGIENFRWDNWHGRRMNDRSEKEKFIRKDIHEIRNLHYLMNYLSPVNEEKEELERTQTHARYGPRYRRDYQKQRKAY